jgi:hypothetical protein
LDLMDGKRILFPCQGQGNEGVPSDSSRQANAIKSLA